MGRWSVDDDEQDFDALPPNAQCTDCGAAFSRADDDPGTWCDPCSDRRDAHTSALERRWTLERIPTLSAVAASRAGKPMPKKTTRRKAVA
jgi:hypothetical protein